MLGLLYPCMTCSLDVCKIDLLDYAPCPPPMLSYGKFREQVLNRSLSFTELCSIARRCMLGESDLAVDCPEQETTTEVFKSTSQTNIVRIILSVIVVIAGIAVIAGIFRFKKSLRSKQLYKKGRIRYFKTAQTTFTEENNLDNDFDEDSCDVSTGLIKQHFGSIPKKPGIRYTAKTRPQSLDTIRYKILEYAADESDVSAATTRWKSSTV